MSASDIEPIFADIRHTMGVALVNVVWRKLSANQAALRWAWLTLKPHYQSGTIPAAAWLLREETPALDLPPLSAAEHCQARADMGEWPTVNAVLRTYERGNAQNLIAMCCLYSILNLDDKTPAASANTLPLMNAQREQTDRIRETIPALPDWNELTPARQKDIKAMADTWVPEQYRSITPSVFRHLTYWPDLFSLVRDRLLQLHRHSPQQVPLATTACTTLATQLAARTGLNQSTVTPLERHDREWLKQLLDQFINGMIGPGVVIVPAMRRLFDSDCIQAEA